MRPSWQRERAAATAAAFVPLSFAPGEAYQFDWSHEVVLIDGTTVTVKVAHVRLCHSRMLFVRAYPRESQEMVFDAHDRAFAFFKGACTRGIYDNMKTAVETIFVGKERAYNRRFLQMCGHYLVDPVACTPASGWEKGQVENQVGLVRERFFTPRLRVKSYEELNAWLLDRCIAYAKAHPHPGAARPDGLGGVRGGAAEPGALCRPLRRLPCRRRPRSSKTCLVRFDNNRYSVDGERRRPAGRDPRLCRSDRDPPGRARSSASIAAASAADQTVYDPWHYVPVLARKPGALRNGAPFKDWVLPAAWSGCAASSPAADDGDRQMVEILTAVLSDGLPAVEAACAEALSEGVHSADVILNILARRREPASADHDHDPRGAAAAARAGRRLRPLRQPEEGRLMERPRSSTTMGELKLYGMKAAYDEIIATAVKRQHEPQRIVGDLLTAEIAEKQARSIKYQITIAKLPLAKDIDDFDFDGTPINEALVRDLAGGDFLAHQRNVVLVGGTGTGKTHLAIAIARACIRDGARGRFFNVVDLVNRLEAEARAGRQGRIADHLCPHGLRRPRRTRLPALRPVRRPAAVPPDQPALRADLDHRHHQPRLRRMAQRLRRRQDDHRAARPPHPPLRHRRDRQRELALQEPRLTLSATGAGPGPSPPPAPLRRAGSRSSPNEGSLLEADQGSRSRAD